MVGDLFQNYLAVDLLIFVVVVLFTGLSQSHDIPVSVVRVRNHPHQDAIHAAGWVSLFAPAATRGAVAQQVPVFRDEYAMRLPLSSHCSDGTLWSS
jgi:hypothetical protein